MKTTISIPALVSLLLIGTAPSAAAQQADREQMAANVIQADANGDGALTLSEFKTLIDLNAADGLGRAERVKRSGRYSMAFGRIDQNGDGVVTKTEMQALSQR